MWIYINSERTISNFMENTSFRSTHQNKSYRKSACGCKNSQWSAWTARRRSSQELHVIASCHWILTGEELLSFRSQAGWYRPASPQVLLFWVKNMWTGNPGKTWGLGTEMSATATPHQACGTGVPRPLPRAFHASGFCFPQQATLPTSEKRGESSGLSPEPGMYLGPVNTVQEVTPGLQVPPLVPMSQSFILEGKTRRPQLLTVRRPSLCFPG